MSEGGSHQAGNLTIDDEVRRSLVALRARSDIHGRAEVDLDELHAIEAAFAITFADDMLATFAAAIPMLIDRYQLKLAMVVGHTGALRTRGARGDLVGVGHDKSEDVFFCVDKSTAATTSLLLFDPDRKTVSPTPLVDWLKTHAAALGPGNVGAGSPSARADFSPKLVREMPGTPSGRRARHAKFGEGRVLREIGTGPLRRVQVAFPNIGLKLLQARFLEFLDD